MTRSLWQVVVVDQGQAATEVAEQWGIKKLKLEVIIDIITKTATQEVVEVEAIAEDKGGRKDPVEAVVALPTAVYLQLQLMIFKPTKGMGW